MSKVVTRPRKKDDRPAEYFARYHKRARKNRIGLAYQFTRVFLVPLMVIVWRLDALGLKNIPKDGPVIIVPSHRHYLDHFILAALMWRRVRFVAKSGMFKWHSGWFLANGGCIPLQRGSGDQEMFASARSALKAGHAVVIYQDGGRVRKGEKRIAHTGPARLSQELGVPILPVGIPNSLNIFSLRNNKQVSVFGKVLGGEKIENATREQHQQLANEVLAEMIELDNAGQAHLDSDEPPVTGAGIARAACWGLVIVAISIVVTDYVK